MTIAHTRKSIGFGAIDGTGFVMYGSNPATKKWFERWFVSIEAAQAYAAKHGWTITSTPQETMQPRTEMPAFRHNQP